VHDSHCLSSQHPQVLSLTPPHVCCLQTQLPVSSPPPSPAPSQQAPQLPVSSPPPSPALSQCQPQLPVLSFPPSLLPSPRQQVQAARPRLTSTVLPMLLRPGGADWWRGPQELAILVGALCASEAGGGAYKVVCCVHAHHCGQSWRPRKVNCV
jgi:hypothetical protein